MLVVWVGTGLPLERALGRSIGLPLLERVLGRSIGLREWRRGLRPKGLRLRLRLTRRNLSWNRGCRGAGDLTR